MGHVRFKNVAVALPKDKVHVTNMARTKIAIAIADESRDGNESR